MASFSQCSSSKEAAKQSKFKFQDMAPFVIDNISCQRWTAGIKEGGSGIHMYVMFKSMKKDASLDSVYFRGLRGKVEVGKMGYYANLKSELNKTNDLILSSDSNEEYGNQLTKTSTKMPFELNNNECVLSYSYKNERLYYKVSDIVEKQPINYPSTPPNKQ